MHTDILMLRSYVVFCFSERKSVRESWFKVVLRVCLFGLLYTAFGLTWTTTWLCVRVLAYVCVLVPVLRSDFCVVFWFLGVQFVTLLGSQSSVRDFTGSCVAFWSRRSSRPMQQGVGLLRSPANRHLKTLTLAKDFDLLKTRKDLGGAGRLRSARLSKYLLATGQLKRLNLQGCALHIARSRFCM